MNKLITNNKEYVEHDIITDCECAAHLLRVVKFTDEADLSISHYSCSPQEVDESKDLCWDVILDKKKSIELATAILEIYK
tara:strand:+ start:167 stop:406 length:240 start_codon:yes stop_codon:yes gene_type:complete